jgi:SAM-dependent methyltransferase
MPQAHGDPAAPVAPTAREDAVPRSANLDRATVDGFGAEWSTYRQDALDPAERRELFDRYFALLDWSALPSGAEGFDLGCGSGRWAALAAPRVGRLHCIDASAAALATARRNLAAHGNCVFHHASVDALPLAGASMDFGYSLGVLHHVPDPLAGLRDCVRALKPGAPFVLYLYYALDGRPWWYVALWRATDLLRAAISRLPFRLRAWICAAIAAGVYYPLARSARAAARLGLDTSAFPLDFYRDRSFYTMRTDALDRFGTRLERRFTRDQVADMMRAAGLEGVRVADGPPFWRAIGFRATADGAHGPVDARHPRGGAGA